MYQAHLEPLKILFQSYLEPLRKPLYSHASLNLQQYKKNKGTSMLARIALQSGVNKITRFSKPSSYKVSTRGFASYSQNSSKQKHPLGYWALIFFPAFLVADMLLFSSIYDDIKNNKAKNLTNSDLPEKTAKPTEPKPKDIFNTPPNTAFPVHPPYSSGFLQTGSIHQVHYTVRGNPNGIPVIVMHGGPGAHTAENQLQIFDPSIYKIIAMDQRGCGQSTPTGCLDNNTTGDLVLDMELLRQHLNIHQWVVAGDSWGSTLAVTYAKNYPNKTLGLLLRGVFLARESDAAEFLSPKGIAAKTYPEEWLRFVSHIDPEDRNNMKRIVSAFQKKLSIEDYDQNTLEAWNRWEILCSVTPALAPEILDQLQIDISISGFQIEAEYILKNFFLNQQQNNTVLDNLNKLPKHLPVHISHGERDYVCPIHQADTLIQALKNVGADVTSTFTSGGHAGGVPEMVNAKVNAASALAAKLISRCKSNHQQPLLSGDDNSSSLFSPAGISSNKNNEAIQPTTPSSPEAATTDKPRV